MINASRGIHRRRWSPGDIDTSLWIDIKDYSTLTLNGSRISGVADKSGSSYNLSQTAAAYQPIYSNSGLNGFPAILFDGINDRLTNILFYLPSQFNKYIVFKDSIGDGKASSLILSESSYSGSKIVNEILLSNNYFGNNGISITAREKTPSFGCNPSNLLGTASIVSCGWDGISNNNKINYLICHNGTYYDLTASVSVGYLTNEGGLSIGMRDIQYFIPFSGLISEILITDYIGSANDIEIIFGYLAHKWWNDAGVENTLPSNHKYKHMPPML